MSLHLPFYLTKSPKDAILILFNETYNTTLTPFEMTVSAPTAISDTLTQVSVSRMNETLEDLRDHYIGSTPFRYHRLRVSDIFGSTFKIDHQLPLSVTSLLQDIEEHTKIKFDQGDFIDGVIRTLPYRLHASPSSLRWIGYVDLVSSMPNIEDVLTGDTIDAFEYQEL